MLTISRAKPDAGGYRHDPLARDGRAASAWLGRAARMLGLRGAVDDEAYQQLYQGQLPGSINAKIAEGTASRRPAVPAWDLTFAAPRAVSLKALLGGDQRLVRAHQKAVRETFAIFMEKHVATTPRRHDDEQGAIKTANLVAATYHHRVNRAGQPYLHSHVVLMNATRDPGGSWRRLACSPLHGERRAMDWFFLGTLLQATEALGYRCLSHEPDGTIEIEADTADPAFRYLIPRSFQRPTLKG